MDDKGAGKGIYLTERVTELIAALPALLLCADTLLMLILDLSVPAMADAQFIVYPVLIKLSSVIAALCAALCFTIRIDNGGLKKSPEAMLLIAFVIWMIISTAINGISKETLFGIEYRFIGVFDLILYVAGFLYCSSCISTDRMRLNILSLFLVTADLIAPAFIFNEITGAVPAFQKGMEPGALFYHGNHYGYFLVMAIVISAGYVIFEKEKRFIAGFASLIINLAALVMDRSMGAVVSAGLVLCAMAVMAYLRGDESAKRRVRTISMVVAVSAVLALVLSSRFRYDLVKMYEELTGLLNGNNNIYAGNGRWGLWQFTVIYIKDRPVWGYGCEGITEMLNTLTRIPNPHNEILTYAAYFGIPAALFYTAALIMMLAKGIRAGADSCPVLIATFAALGYFVSSLFGVAVFYTAPFLFVFLGIGCSEGNRNVL